MDTIMKNLDAAFRLLVTIAVKGDDVESMAAAKGKLRIAYAELEKMKEGQNDG